MGIVLLVVLPALALMLMSAPMRFLAIVSLLGLGGYALYVKQFHGFSGPTTAQAGMFMTLYGVTTGVFGLGVILGVMRSVSSSEERYTARRGRFFGFLLMWGTPFIVIKAALGYWIDRDTGEPGGGALILGLLGSYLFIAYVVCAILVKLAFDYMRERRAESGRGRRLQRRAHGRVL